MKQRSLSPKERDGLQEEEVAQKAMGDCGRWQVSIILLLCLLKLPIAWNQLGIVFLAAPTSYHCSNSSRGEHCETDGGEPCSRWDYDRSVFSRTIITEWDLVCQRHQLVNVAQMVLMIGILVGNIVFSMAADRFGRKVPLVLSGVLQMLTGVAASFSPWFSTFLVFRFLSAVATGGAMTIGFVLCMEILSGKWRTTVTTLSHIPFNIGQETMVAIAYYTRDWRHFQLAISLPSALAIIYLWLIPESPRWLLAMGRYEEAVAVLRKAADVNKNHMPTEISFKKTEKQQLESEHNAGVTDLLRTPNLRTRTLAMWFNWMACGLCFYGLTQYVSNFSGDVFVNVAIAGSLVLPGMLVTLYTLDKFGRKATLIGGQLIASTACFLIIFFPEGPGNSDLPRVVLGSIGILGMGISFPTAYLYSGELFPTVVRNVGVGSGSMCARVGSMVAPFMASLSEYNRFLSPLLFSFIPLAAAFAGTLLPETRGCSLPQTIEEGENFGKSNSKSSSAAATGVRNEGFQVES